jgi:hypothetical protein
VSGAGKVHPQNHGVNVHPECTEAQTLFPWDDHRFGTLFLSEFKKIIQNSQIKII